MNRVFLALVLGTLLSPAAPAQRQPAAPRHESVPNVGVTPDGRPYLVRRNATRDTLWLSRYVAAPAPTPTPPDLLPPVPKPEVPTPTPAPADLDGLRIGEKGGLPLVLRRLGGRLVLTQQRPDGGFFPRGDNFLEGAALTAPFDRARLQGGTTGWWGNEAPAGLTPPPGFERRTEPDGAVYFAPESPITPAPVPAPQPVVPTPVPQPVPTPPTPDRVIDTARTGTALREIRYPITPAGRPGLVNWAGVAPFRLNPNEYFLWEGLVNSEAQITELLQRGVTHISVRCVWTYPNWQKLLPVRNRYAMIDDNAWNGSPHKGGRDMAKITEALVREVVTRWYRGLPAGGVDWVDLDWEWTGGDGPNRTAYGNVNRWAIKTLRELGVRLVGSYEGYPVGWNPNTPEDGHSAYFEELTPNQVALIDIINNIPYAALNNWVNDPQRGWYQADFTKPEFQQLREERRRTQADWLYRNLKALDANVRLIRSGTRTRNGKAPATVGYVTHGWAEFGYPAGLWGVVRDDIFRGQAIFQFVGGGEGLAVWAENETPPTGWLPFLRTGYEAVVQAMYELSTVNEFRTGERQYLNLEYSLDGGRTRVKGTPWTWQKNRHPAVKAIVKGNQILVAACDPYFFAGTRTLTVYCGDWQGTLTLNPYDTYLGVAALR